MANIITVHGTNAGHTDDDGEKWWQRGSPFIKAVQRYIHEPLNVTPFHWTGANSETNRRKAGARLSSLIEDSDNPIVIGHSHGGSATVHALLLRHLRRKKSGLDKVRGFVSIGMPMVRFKSNRNPLSWFNLTGRLLLLTVLGIFSVFFLREVDTAIRNPTSIFSGNGTGVFAWLPPTELLLAGAAAIFFVWFLRRNFLRQRTFAKNTLATAVADRHIALNHSNDEAINGLDKGLKLKPKMIRGKTFFVSVFSTVAFVLVANIYIQIIGTEIVNRATRLEISDGIRVPGKITTDSFTQLVPAGDLSAYSQISRFFMRRVQTNQELQHVALREIIDQLRAEHQTSWFEDEFSELIEKIHFYTDDKGRSAQGFAASVERMGQLFVTNDSDSEVDSNTGIILSVMFKLTLSGAAPIISFEDTTAILIDDGQKEAHLKEGAEFFVPLSEFISMKWECRNDAPLAPDFCRVFNLGSWRFADYFLVPAHGAYQYLDDGLFSITASEAWEPIAKTGVDYSVFTENIALLLPIIVFTAAVGLVGMVILTPIANTFLVTTIKSTAFGNDGYGERPVGVSPSLDFSSSTVGTLPTAIEKQMISNSERDAPAAINRFRELLSSGKLSGGATDTDALSMAMQFDKSELLHNAYFHSDLFVKYVATCLVERFGVEPNDVYRGDADIAMFAEDLKTP